MNQIRLILAFVWMLVVGFAYGAWYDNPVVRSTQSSGHANTSVHYINLSEDGQYLMVNLHSSNDAFPVQVYTVADLVATKGAVLDLTCPEAFDTQNKINKDKQGAQ